MKILCPNCNQAIKLSDLGSHGVQTEYCSKCKTLVYATYETREGGRKIWDIHYEKPPDPKKKEPKPKNGCLALLLLGLAILAVVILIRAYADLKIININGP